MQGIKYMVLCVSQQTGVIAASTLSPFVCRSRMKFHLHSLDPMRPVCLTTCWGYIAQWMSIASVFFVFFGINSAGGQEDRLKRLLSSFNPGRILDIWHGKR